MGPASTPDASVPTELVGRGDICGGGNMAPELDGRTIGSGEAIGN